MFFRSNYWQRGEIATTLTLIAVVVMAAGALLGANLTRNQDVRSLAQNSCGLSAPPSVIDVTNTGVTCQYIAVAPSEGYVCALVDENESPGNQITAGQEIPWGGAWNGNIAAVPLPFKPGKSINSNHMYTLVVYHYASPDSCKQTQSYSGVNLTTNIPIETNPTSTTAPVNQPNQCTNESGICVASPNDCQGANVQLVSGLGCTGGYCCKPKSTSTVSTPTCTNFTLYADALAACNESVEIVPGFTSNCFRCKTSTTATCTTSMTTTSRASQWCGSGNYESVPGIPSCYRCKIAASGCFPTIGNCSINCSGNYECKQESSSCYRCIPRTTPKNTPTPTFTVSNTKCYQEKGGFCTTASTCNQFANSQALFEPLGCISPNSACCVITDPAPAQNNSSNVVPVSVQLTTDRSGCSNTTYSNGYVRSVCKDGTYVIPYVVSQNNRNQAKIL